MTTPAMIKKLSRNVVARSIACWLGAQYIRIVDMTSFWKFDGEFGPAFGGGMKYQLNSGQGIKIDYSYKTILSFTNTHNYTLSLTF